MKKSILLYVLLLIPISNVNAQLIKEPRGFLKFGTGYYLDVSRAFDDYQDSTSGISPEKTVGGKTIWIEGGYKLPNNIIVSAHVMFASLKREYIDLLYQGQKYMVFHQNYAVNFSYEFNSSGNHKFLTGFGLLYNIRSTAQADYGVEIIDEVDDQQLGINLNLDYYYQFENKFFIGARVNTIYLISIGLEGFVFSPIFGVKF